MGRLEYDGRKDLLRKRKLVEEPAQSESSRSAQDILPSPAQNRLSSTDELFAGLGRTYIRGQKIKDGLSKMDPAQSIPIEPNANSTRAAAIHIAPEESLNGEIITFSMYQKCVDTILAKKWELRATYLSTKIPASREEQLSHTIEVTSKKGAGESLIKDFLAEGGISGTILMMLTLSPFQTIIFQPLTVEEGAKAIQVAQIPAGIALFLELGIKAEKIISLLKGAKVHTPIVEEVINRLDNDPAARAEALDSVGIDYNEFKESQEVTDSQQIITYVSEYYQRYGGLVAPGSHLSLDHWVAYLQVAQNQQTVRSSLNIADNFSPEFKSYRSHFEAPPDTKGDSPVSESANNTPGAIFTDLASTCRSLKTNSDDMYDQILYAMSYTLSDKDLCCLVSILGAHGDTSLMKTLANVLRILALDLGGEINKIYDIARRLLFNFMHDAMFEIVAKLNRAEDKIMHKLTKAFTVDFKDLEACGGLLTIGWALMHSTSIIFNQMRGLLDDLMSSIASYADVALGGVWESAADRRHLLGIARILEVLAYRLDAANVCDGFSAKFDPTKFDSIDKDSSQAIFSIMQDLPPNIQISDSDVQRYFPHLKEQTSQKLKFSYGIKSQQNPEATNSRCEESESSQKIESMLGDLTNALKTAFNE